MSWYDEYKEQWREIIQTVASEEHRTTQMVEKDTIQSMILLGLSKSDVPFVFKGGTNTDFLKMPSFYYERLESIKTPAFFRNYL